MPKEGAQSLEDQKACIIKNGFNNKNFIKCYGRNFSKMLDEMNNQLKEKYYDIFEGLLKSILSMCKYDETSCL